MHIIRHKTSITTITWSQSVCARCWLFEALWVNIIVVPCLGDLIMHMRVNVKTMNNLRSCCSGDPVIYIRTPFDHKLFALWPYCVSSGLKKIYWIFAQFGKGWPKEDLLVFAHLSSVELLSAMFMLACRSYI